MKASFCMAKINLCSTRSLALLYGKNVFFAVQRIKKIMWDFLWYMTIGCFMKYDNVQSPWYETWVKGVVFQFKKSPLNWWCLLMYFWPWISNNNYLSPFWNICSILLGGWGWNHETEQPLCAWFDRIIRTATGYSLKWRHTRSSLYLMRMTAPRNERAVLWSRHYAKMWPLLAITLAYRIFSRRFIVGQHWNCNRGTLWVIIRAS